MSERAKNKTLFVKTLFAGLLNGKDNVVCVGNAFMRSERSVGLLRSLDDSAIGLISIHFHHLMYRSKSLSDGMHECIPCEQRFKQPFITLYFDVM